MAFVIRDFVNYYDVSTCVASESQMESANKQCKNQNWPHSSSNCIQYVLRGNHEESMANILTEDALEKVRFTITDENYHFDAKKINESYLKLHENVRKIVFMIFNAPKVVIDKYDFEMNQALSEPNSVEIAETLGANIKNDPKKMNELGNQLSEDNAILEDYYENDDSVYNDKQKKSNKGDKKKKSKKGGKKKKSKKGGKKTKSNNSDSDIENDMSTFG